MPDRTWTCQRIAQGRKCGTVNPARKQNCGGCGKRKRDRRPKHTAVMRATTYEECVELYGERCGICGARPGRTKLHRDHEHKGTGAIRGLLCYPCNAALRTYMTLDWLRAAVAYLERFEQRRGERHDGDSGQTQQTGEGQAPGQRGHQTHGAADGEGGG